MRIQWFKSYLKDYIGPSEAVSTTRRVSDEPSTSARGRS
jgi:hypothetical protein